ncbi:unnamed protein product [Linum tenue]|uniref:Uncharacterized protein n=1 Tax=Linum tenue TaxID=586396 RepID=A0AAV0QXY7_9ROSI|nr:unnamed protein product [Linum tenue]
MWPSLRVWFGNISKRLRSIIRGRLSATIVENYQEGILVMTPLI